MDGEPEPAPDPSPNVTIKTSDASNATVLVSVDDQVDLILVDQNEGDVNHSVTTATDNVPDAATEPRTPQKETPPGDVSPQSPSVRKYRALYENMRERNLELQKKYDHDAAEYAKNMDEKDATIKELNARLGKLSQSTQSGEDV